MFYLGKCDILGKKEGENMPFETLKKSHVKRNILIGVVIVLIISAVILNFTKAKYRVTQSIPLVNGTINYSLADLNLVGVYIQGDDGYTKTDTIPESGYVLNEEESYCTVNGEKDASINVSYDADTQTLSVSPMTTKGTKCYLYFDEELCPAGAEACNTILAGKELATRTDFSTTLTTDTTGTIYYADTSKGRTYYFAGNPTDNWVSFGGFYWRIIRINEDGTIRLIYQGTSANTTGTGTQLQTSAFNNLENNNMYVGYMYGSGVHGLTSSSTIKGILDNWYRDNLAPDYGDKIDGNAGFCGDREPSTSSSTSNGSGGTGTTQTYYGGHIRLTVNQNSVSPTFECKNDSDLYTTSGSENGNKALTYPIGLISADEVVYAGGSWFSNNRSYYLYTNSVYWTMSPYYFRATSGRAGVFRVDDIGRLNYNYVYDARGVRPVINLKANVQITGGNGSSSSPYVIS